MRDMVHKMFLRWRANYTTSHESTLPETIGRTLAGTGHLALRFFRFNFLLGWGWENIQSVTPPPFSSRPYLKVR